MGKKGTPELLYKASRDGFSSSVFWEKTKYQNGTIALVSTNFDSVIGGYNPDQWEDTTGMENHIGWKGWKDITSGSPFLFYWVSDEIQVIKHRAGIPTMKSDKNILMLFGLGLSIGADQNSFAYADDYYWVYPQNTGNLKISFRWSPLLCWRQRIMGPFQVLRC
jgi:hypothetical protein